MNTTHKIAVIGGTGPQGRGLAFRLAHAGHAVVIGSRAADRAAEAAGEVQARAGGSSEVRGTDNVTAAQDADIVLLALPYDGHAALVEALSVHLTNKIVI